MLGSRVHYYISNYAGLPLLKSIYYIIIRVMLRLANRHSICAKQSTGSTSLKVGNFTVMVAIIVLGLTGSLHIAVYFSESSIFYGSFLKYVLIPLGCATALICPWFVRSSFAFFFRSGYNAITLISTVELFKKYQKRKNVNKSGFLKTGVK
uniref:Putative gag-pol polyprotein strongylocentrotus purpuratus: similar to gag-pol polyprotein n=1 Tax=Ixodes ricinus TaxID=34613 RepID=A0A0K8RHM6_IXORI